LSWDDDGRGAGVISFDYPEQPELSRRADGAKITDLEVIVFVVGNAEAACVFPGVYLSESYLAILSPRKSFTAGFFVINLYFTTCSLPNQVGFIA